MRPAKPDLMMGFAVLASRMSTCSRLHVGCVLTDDDYEQIAFGYNGTFRGGPNECLHPDKEGGCGCVHAETNAVIKARFKPTKAFVTDSPCEICSSALVNAGLKEVWYARPYRLDDGIRLLEAAGIRVHAWEPEDVHAKLSEEFSLDVTNSVFGWNIVRGGWPGENTWMENVTGETMPL